MNNDHAATRLPVYRKAIDWDALYSEYPVPDVYEQTVYRWTAERIRDLQNRRFLEIMKIGWENPFYQAHWKQAGLAPSDIRGLDDIGKLPTFNSDDIKTDQNEHPPMGLLAGYAGLREHLLTTPSRLQSSGGTTGKPRYTLQGIRENEVNAISAARALYLQGVRPGDVLQIPATCSLASLPWAYAKACTEYLGVLPVTTGSGVVTHSRLRLRCQLLDELSRVSDTAGAGSQRRSRPRRARAALQAHHHISWPRHRGHIARAPGVAVGLSGV